MIRSIKKKLCKANNKLKKEKFTLYLQDIPNNPAKLQVHARFTQ